MDGSRVFVGGLPHDICEEDVEKFFKGCGRITEIFMKIGYCFVEFDDSRDADDAIEKLHKKKFKETRVTVQTAQKKGSHSGTFGNERRNEYGDRSQRDRLYYGRAFSTKNRLIVKNLSSDVQWRQLKDYMRQVGEVKYSEAHTKHLNEGMVEFLSVSDMKNAIKKLDDTKLNGKRIQLVEDRRGEYNRRFSRSRLHFRSRKRRYSSSKSPIPSISRRNRSSESPGTYQSEYKSTSKYSRLRSHSNHRHRSIIDLRSPSVKKRVSVSRSGTPDRTPKLDSPYSPKGNSRSRKRSLKSRSHSKTASPKRGQQSRLGKQEPDTTSNDRLKPRNPFQSRNRSASKSNRRDWT